MKIKRHKKETIIELLDLIKMLMTAERSIMNKVNPINKYPERSHQPTSMYSEWGFYDYYNVLSIVYLELVDQTEKEVYHAYSCSSQDDLPKAQYRSEFWKGPDRLEPPDPKYGGYIPDKINDVILDENIASKDKYALLLRMFKDLVKITKAHKAKTKVLEESA